MNDNLPVPALIQFEEIRHTDDLGEYWTARELQKILGYASWDKFDGAIDDAIAVCAREGEESVKNNFSRSGKVSGKRGPTQKDYRITRHACYLIAMSCDGNKTEAALAKIYFAVAVELCAIIERAKGTAAD